MIEIKIKDNNWVAIPLIYGRILNCPVKEQYYGKFH